MGGTCAADSRARTRFIAQRKLFMPEGVRDSIPGATGVGSFTSLRKNVYITKT
jgi:hypothetical protein